MCTGPRESHVAERGSFDETAAKAGVYKLRWQDEVGKVVL